MQQDKDIQVEGTTADHLAQKLMDEEQGQEFALEYLKSDFLTAAVNALFYMRRESGLTQAQVAERLHTTQSAVARTEGDFDGGISLRRYVDFALACGMVPHNITFAPLHSVVSYTIAQPNIPFTQVNHQEWLKANFLPLSTFDASVTYATSNTMAISQLKQTQSEAVFSLEESPKKSSASSLQLVPTVRDASNPQKFVQQPLEWSLQLLPGRSMTNTVSEPQGKTLNLFSTNTNQSHTEVAG
jgi:transcriptional regulator with XRE-family HTH domain